MADETMMRALEAGYNTPGLEDTR